MTLNNTIITVVNPQGIPVFSCSGGKLGFRGVRRASTVAAEEVAKKTAGFLSLKKQFHVEVVLKNVFFFGNNMVSSVLRAFELGGIQIVSIRDKVSNAHNGCRFKKARRV